MPTGAAPAPAAAAAQQEGNGMSPLLKAGLQAMAVYFGMQMLTGYLKGPQQAVTTKDSTGAVVTVPNNNGPIPSYWERPASLDEGASYSAVPHRIAPIWPLDSAMDVTIVVSPTFVHEPLDRVSAERKVVQEKSFKMSDKKDKRVVDTSFEMPKEVRNNGTLWGHFYVALSGKPLDPSAHSYDPASAYHFVRPLTQYLTKKKVVKTKNLLASNTTVEEEPEEDPKQRLINSFYHPNFTMSFVPDSGVMNYQSLHPAVKQYVTLDQTAARDGSGLNGWYYPVLFVNTFWQLRSQMTELNNTVTRVPFHVDLNTQANWLFSIISSIDEGNKAQQRQIAAGQPLPAGGDGSEFEMFKEILLDSNMYLLITTAVASVLHMIFEMLAFKNDISHYRNKKDNVGISVRSILGNVFMQTVIFLYLLDNNENTSWMILFGQGMGIAIELWKITTVVNIRVLPAPPGSWFPYTVKFEDKHVLSDTEEKTKEYDAIAFKYLYIIAVPLLIAYAIYSLMYDTHKSWYSFIITTLVGSVYAYGFLMMVPSLYINYRLKSVAHMPRKAMVYKFLNTFIDDLFAFTIRMPLLHRLATLRDDVIFFVYLYQGWKYKVDYTRVNEFGQVGTDDVEVTDDKLAAAKGIDDKLSKEASKAVGGAESVAKDIAAIAGVKASGSEKKEGATKRR